MYLSIIIPVYNTEQYIRQCVMSCIQNVDFEYEIIIVDDGTQDRSIKMIVDLINENDQIKLYHQTNQGLSAARNTGFKYATGQYVWFVDSDDWVCDNSIKQIASSIGQECEHDIVAFNANYLYKNNTVQTAFNIKTNKTIHGFEFLLKTPIYSVWRFWYKREYLNDQNLLFVKGLLHEDSDFVFRSLAFAQKVIYINVLGYNYRPQRIGSIMNTMSLKRACTGIEYLYLSEDLLNNKILTDEQIAFLCYERIFKLNWSYIPMYNDLSIIDQKLFIKEFSNARRLLIKYIVKTYRKKYYLFLPVLFVSPYFYLKIILLLYKMRH